MPTTSFRQWLSLLEQHAIPEATKLNQLLHDAGTVGISRHDLGRAIELQPDTLDNLLAALVAAGQVAVSEVDGERVYRAMG